MPHTEILGAPAPASGRIRDLEGHFTSPTNVMLSWRLQELVPGDPNHLTATVFDAQVTDYAENDELSSDIVIGSPGSHGVDVRRVPRVGELVNIIQYASGDSVYLDWDRSVDEDLSAYTIYRDGQIVSSVSNVAAEDRRYAASPSGGRYSVSGTYDQLINRWIAVKFNEPNVMTFESTSYAFLESGMSYSLPYGLTLTLHDAPEMYTDFSIFVGVQSWVTLTDQPPGEHTYRISANDNAGNVSTTIIERRIYVHPIPTGDYPIFNDVTGELLLAGNVDEVRIYSDMLPSNVTLPYIYEEAPYETVLTSRVLTVPPGARFYARPIIDGVEHQTLTIYTMRDPMVIPGEIGRCTDLIGTARPGGAFALTWLYAIPDDDKAEEFWIYSSTTAGYNFEARQTAPRNIVSNVYNEVLEYTADIDSWPTGTEVYFYVVAVDIDGTNGLRSNTIILFADATPPTLSGDLDGINI